MNAGPPFDDENIPVLLDCPQCGKGLVNSGPRREMDGMGTLNSSGCISAWPTGSIYVRPQRGPKERTDGGTL